MFSLDKIVIISSLGNDDTDTARLLREYLISARDDFQRNLQIELIQCRSANDFTQIIGNMTLAAAGGHDWPLVHVEAHGDISSGLIFSDDSELEWDRVADLLRDLNVATKFNLMTVFTACFGAYFQGQMFANKPAPSYGMLAPTSTIDPGECIRSTFGFYRILFERMDVGAALSHIQKNPLYSGGWHAVRADVWFVHLMGKFAENHCTQEGIQAQAREVYKGYKRVRRKSPNLQKSIPFAECKRLVIEKTKVMLYQKAFAQYFSIDTVKANEARFSHAQDELNSLLKRLPLAKELKSTKGSPR